jgi:hypothetical protein
MQRILITAMMVMLVGAMQVLAESAFAGGRVGGLTSARPELRGSHGRIGSPFPRPPGDRFNHQRSSDRRRMHPRHPVKPVHPIHPGDKPHKPGYKPPGYWWPATRTVVRETETIVIVTTPAPAEPPAPPKPEEIWVPPVMGTRTQPGYWDYGVKKVWMGDHWRYEQDLDARVWVPESSPRDTKVV